MQFTLKQLQIFLGIASTGSLVAAAKQLQLSQPAVSMALAELESILGEKLFDRWGKRVEINQSGMMLLPIAKKVVAQGNEIDWMFSEANQNGVLRLGASSTLASYVVPLIISGFNNKFPDIEISLVSGNRVSTLMMLENYEIDIALIAGNPNNAKFEQILLHNDDMTVFCSCDHPLAGKDTVSFADLMEAKWVLREPGSWSRERLILAMGTEAAKLNVQMVLDNTEAIKQVVRLCPVIGCVSRMAIMTEIQDGRLIALPVAEFDLTRSFYLVLGQKRHRSRVLKAFLAYCTSEWPQSLHFSKRTI